MSNPDIAPQPDDWPLVTPGRRPVSKAEESLTDDELQALVLLVIDFEQQLINETTPLFHNRDDAAIRSLRSAKVKLQREQDQRRNY